MSLNDRSEFFRRMTENVTVPTPAEAQQVQDVLDSLRAKTTPRQRQRLEFLKYLIAKGKVS